MWPRPPFRVHLPARSWKNCTRELHNSCSKPTSYKSTRRSLRRTLEPNAVLTLRLQLWLGQHLLALPMRLRLSFTVCSSIQSFAPRHISLMLFPALVKHDHRSSILELRSFTPPSPLVVRSGTPVAPNHPDPFRLFFGSPAAGP